MDESLYVVLGMHRGGTSAVARAISALGVNLGNNLMPGVPGVNELGFWEDRDIVDLNDRVLSAFSASWHSVKILGEHHADPVLLDDLSAEGRSLLQDRIGRFSPYGFKDPRTARILSFWRPLFQALNLQPRYVIVLRNPVSVAHSLRSRDNFPAEKSHLLWMLHMLSALRWSEGHPRVVVDYDRMIADPSAQLDRIRQSLLMPEMQGVPPCTSDFLKDELRHFRFDERALEPNEQVPRLVVRLYELASRLARDQDKPNGEQVSSEANGMWVSISNLAPAFALAEMNVIERASSWDDTWIAQTHDERDIRLFEFGKVVANRDEHIRQLSEHAAARDKEVAEFAKVVANRDEHIRQLSEHAAARDKEVAEFAKVVANREEHIRQLSEHAAIRDKEVADFTQVIASQHDEIRELTDRATELERTSSGLAAAEAALFRERTVTRTLRARLDQIGHQLFGAETRIHNLEGSSFWRTTMPLRVLWRFIETRLLGRNFQFRLVPNQELETIAGDNFWRSVGTDPFFELIPEDVGYPSGSVLVTSTLHRSSRDQTLKLYYDAGQGMTEGTAIGLPVDSNGSIYEIIRLPRHVYKLRWDPISDRGEFTQGPISITKMWPIERFVRRLLILREVKSWSPAALLDAAGVSWKNFLLRPSRTYAAASALRNQTPKISYESWLNNQALTSADKSAIQEHIQRFSVRPLISVVMPTYETPAPLLRDAIESLLAQQYQNWELCIADDASKSPHVRDIIEEYRSRDRRIKVAYRTANGHISAASNSALALAEGEFVALLDHDDMFSELALYQVAAELNTHPETDIIYSDEDKIDEQGRHTRPHFKTEWNPDLLYSQNYISHLGVFRTSLVRAVGGFREGLEGSQDYDLFLRCIAATTEDRLRHIPAILYHWRATEGSTALSDKDKNYATDHGIKALGEYLRKHVSPGVVVEPGHYATTYKVRFPLPDIPPKVSLIIPTRDGYDILRTCISSILEKTTYPNYEVVIVDNQSSDPRTLQYFDEVKGPRVRILKYDRPFSYSALNNFAVEQVGGEIIGLINNDIEIITLDWLTEMVSHAIRPDIGAVGAKLYYPNDTIQHAGVIIGLGGVAGHSHKHYGRESPGYYRRLFLVQNVSAVTGACLVVRKSTYEKVGGLNEKDLPIAFNDVDFCLRLRELGLRNLWTPYAELYHHESVSRGLEDSPEKVMRFQREVRFMKERWGDGLLHDPYYSPMLTLDREDFSPNFGIPQRRPWLEDERS
jgi:GT2 family glycosyltransferase